MHKDQFKSLLVPNRLSGVFSKAKAKEVEVGKKKRRGSVASGKHSQSTDQHTFSSETGTNESEHDLEGRRHNETSDSDSMSTEGEESVDPHSPAGAEGQSLKQSTDLKAALASSKALQGDYVELKNCKRCGSMIFKVSSKVSSIN